MSFLDHAMILFGVALGAFFAGWFVEWLRFGAVIEQHKQITESLTKQYAELEKRLTFSKSANKDLSDARFAAERERDAAVARFCNLEASIAGANAKPSPKKRARK